MLFFLVFIISQVVSIFGALYIWPSSYIDYYIIEIRSLTLE